MDWPGRSDGEYKSMRFFPTEKYPWIDENTPDSAEFLLTRRRYILIVLKAFHGAPAFAEEELCAFRQVFEEVVEFPQDWHFYKHVPTTRELIRETFM